MNAFDASILHWLNQFANQAPAFDRFVSWLASAHLVKGCAVVATVWGVWFAAAPAAEQLQRRQRLLMGLLAAMVGEMVARVAALKLPFRFRPVHNESFGFQLPDGIKRWTLDGWSAFPSDHATLFFALATGIWFASRSAGRWMFAYVAIVICLPRIYLGLHHPTDILAGAAIGIGVTVLFEQAVVRGVLARPFSAWELRAPATFYAFAFIFSMQLAMLFDPIRELPWSLHQIRHGLGQ